MYRSLDLPLERIIYTATPNLSSVKYCSNFICASWSGSFRAEDWVLLRWVWLVWLEVELNRGRWALCSNLEKLLGLGLLSELPGNVRGNTSSFG